MSPLRCRAVLLVFVAACQKPAPPAPTVALAEAARPGVTLERAGHSIPLDTERRVEEGAELRTPEAGRASLRLDGGSWALLDARSRVRVSANRLELGAGRLWVDARDVDATTVAFPGGTLTATAAGFAVDTGPEGVRAYCVSGQLTYAARSSNRLEAGMSVRISPSGEVKEEPESQWDDWTGGLAEPGPPRPLEPAGVGQLAARRTDEIGAARAPLLVRRHDVKTTLSADLAVTDVEQIFFNPRSEDVEALYSLRLPPGAILAGFEVRAEGEPSLFLGVDYNRFLPHVVPSAKPGEPVGGISLQWAGPDRYRAAIPSVGAGKTEIVHVRYVEWLARHGKRRTWVYAMGGGSPPLLGEFSLEVETARAGAGALEAGMGAQVDGTKVVLRRSDFRPRSDFALDLLDGDMVTSHTSAYRVATEDGVGKGYVLVGVDPPLGAAPESIDLVLIADVSAATDPTRLDLEKAVVDAVLRQLTPKDRVAVVAASVDARPLGAGPPLAPVTPQRTEELLDALARQSPAGATDLATALEQSARLLDGAAAGKQGGRGVLVYLGDGQPTVGALLPGDLKDRLARLAHPPRLFTVAVGGDARTDLLQALSEGGGIALRVEDRPEAAHAAYRILAAATLPTLQALSYDLGPTVDVVFPTGPLTALAGEPLRLVGRLRGDAPRSLKLGGTRDGEPFSVEIPLTAASPDDSGDIRRRWADGRLRDLLRRGAGREAVVEIGTRFGLVTPWSAMTTASDSSSVYTPLEGSEDRGTYVPAALRDQAPDDAPIALESGVSSVAAGSTNLEVLYGRLLGEHGEGARTCYERRAAGHPELSGRVELKIKVGLGGEIAGLQQLSSTLRDAEVEACIARSVRALRLPPPPDGKFHELVRAWQFEAEDGRLGAPQKCSTASHLYLATRRALWRERLGQSASGVEGAMNVWRGAMRACELKTWLDRRALLDLLRPAVGRTAFQVDLYHRFEGQADVQSYLRREILRAVRTAADVKAVRGGLALDGGIAAELLEAQLKKANDPVGRVRVLRQFLALAPDGIALRVRLLAALEEAKQIDEARRVAWSLRSDPAADLSTRQAIGEFFARQQDADEAARAFSEIVEFAPFDPWARRRLGDLYRAHARYEDAYREYATLAWLVPTDGSVLLLLAQAAAAAGRVDEALRLEERLTETVESKDSAADIATWARYWISLQLAGLRDGARKSSDSALLTRLAARGRSDGVFSWAGQLLIGATWSHPDARLELHATIPGDKLSQRAPVRGGPVGIEALRLARQSDGEYQLSVRRPIPPAGSPARDRVRAFDGELWVLSDEGQTGEQLTRLPLHFAPDTVEATFTLRGHTVTPGKLITAPTAKATH